MTDSPKQFDTQLKALELWQELYRKGALPGPHSSEGWQAAIELSKAVIEADELSKGDLKLLLGRSNEGFRPLADPLAVDFGAHRWLSSEREEAYSDWFGWILEQFDDAGQILRLFAVSGDSPQGCAQGKLKIRREFSILDSSRRPDLVVQLGKRPIFVVEIKTKWFEEVEVWKQLRAYADWAKDNQNPHCFFVAVDIEEFKCPPEFKPLTWLDLSLRLRKQVREWIRASREHRLDGEYLVRAAMVLAFCGAVERNLLKLSGEPKRFQALESKEYLQKWLAQAEEEKDGQI